MVIFSDRCQLTLKLSLKNSEERSWVSLYRFTRHISGNGFQHMMAIKACILLGHCLSRPRNFLLKLNVKDVERCNSFSYLDYPFLWCWSISRLDNLCCWLIMHYAVREVQIFQVTIKLATTVDTHHLKEYLRGGNSEFRQVAIQVLDIVLGATKPPQ